MPRPEQDLQKAAVQFLTAAVPPPPSGPLWFAPDAGIPLPSRTEEQRKHAARIGGIRKAMGVRPGIADLVFLRTPPFVVEFKTGDGRMSKEQRDIAAALNLMGINTHVVRSIDQLVTVLEAEGVPMRAEVLA